MAFILQLFFVVFYVQFLAVISKKTYPNQPKLYVSDGHLHVILPDNKYVQFHTSTFHVNDFELVSTLKGAQNASTLLQSYERFISQYHSKMDDIENRLLNVGTGIQVANGTNATARDPNVFMKFRRIDRRLTTLQRMIINLKSLLTKDDCISNPCKNGGACMDIFNGFICQCPNGWEGSTCEKDVDECARFRGTDLDCQNGGTCQNLPGAYQCYCQNGWVGIHCNRKPTDCSSGGSEMCGHGICIPQNNAAGYKCICDPGWTTDGTHNSCTVDVDECKLNHPPCSTNPLVQCVNVPGSFVCQHCPPGYTGNGYYCSDVNECELFNGGCSVSPFVECINIPGSSKCAACPPGYQGDGKSCSYKGVCSINNGGCSILARCIDNTAISESYVQCLCPPGYAGSGIGPSGCFKSNSTFTSCSPNPCVHGICAPNNSPQGFYCICDPRYSGSHCERQEDPCASNPCMNGGTCQNVHGAFLCKCLTGFSGRFCNLQRQGCGGNIKFSNGTLTYPPTDFASSDSSGAISCAWTIQTDESQVIELNFTKFKIISDGSCSTQWFQVHDGKNSMATPMGRYCGTTPPFNGSVTSTHNIIYFWLRSNGQTPQKPEFQIKWKAKKPECGGQITGGNGMIVSPGWPSSYPNNRDCYWYFNIPSDKRLLFHVYSLNIGQKSDCTGDTLTFNAFKTKFVYDPQQRGPFSITHIRNNNIFGYFCNSTIPEPFYSPYHHGYIYFKSNDKDSYPGFQIGYSTVNGIPGCGGTYTSKDGYIQSIEMTSSMPNPLVCVYEIKIPTNATIRIEIVDMNLDENCGETSVAIFQETTNDSALIGKYCGSTLPGPIVTFGSNVIIQSTSMLFHKNNWKIKYETVCTFRFTDPVKSISGTPTEAEEGCTYHIEQPVGYIILLELSLTSYQRYSQDCTVSPYYVEVRDGDNDNSTLIGRYCKGGEKIHIESSTNYLWIRARLSFSGTRTFSANYTTMDMGCGGLLKKELGTIAFPTHGNGKYMGNKRCRWVIMAPNDKVIQLTWMTFNVEQSVDCTYDHLEVFDNNTGVGMGGSMGKYCGYTLPPVMLSSSNIMTLDFVSDTTIHGDGFLASYTFIKEQHVCGGNYFTSAGVIKSPGYPNNYPTNRECIWTITVPPGNQVSLNITDFDVEAYSSCRYDWLEIRNGGTSSSPLIGRYCGNTIPKIIPSHANKLYLKFNSDMSRTTKGFMLRWSSAATGCGGSLTSPSGSIMSPHYPEPYTKNTDCLWKVVVSAGSKIQVIFADIDLEKHSVCGLDYVQLLDGPTLNSKSLGKFCSQQTTAIVSSSNSMLVRFRSDVSFQGRGFNIQYSALCTNTLTGFGGVIESPNFPNDYPQDQNCLWDIVVSEKNKINITFSHFALERSTTFENKSCMFDYVEIEYQVETLYPDNPDEVQFEKYGRYCGYNNPGLITINSHHVKVHFVSDSLLLGTGFRLEWKLFGCGGILTSTTGTIQSPNYPQPYPSSIECNWIITVPLGQSIAITFSKVEVEKDNTCTLDFIKLYNGKDDSYQLLSTLCYQLKPITITTTGNNLYVQFKADSSYQGPGFIATYLTEPTTCGGTMMAPSGYIFSPNYPKNFDRNETCEWLIHTEENHLVELKFEDVDLIKSNCNKTYIKVYDGPTQAYPLLETICGNTQLNKTIKSSFEQLFIEFRSDSYMTSKGFKASYQKACGATIKTSGGGTLEISKDSISSQTDIGACTYTIQSEDKSKHVTLTITLLSNVGWCDDNGDGFGYLKIYNGPFSDSPLIGSYCGTKVPPPITSDGSALHIEISQAIDFFATYTVLDNQCGGDLISQDGFLATPGWPKQYPSNIECAWTISMGPGNTINLHFLNFDIPESDHCNTDFLEIRETNATGKLLGVYCGTTVPSNLTAVGKFYLAFKSSSLDEGVPSTNKGFKAEYEASTVNTLSGPKGTIANPQYPNPVSVYGSYTWLITTKPGTRIQLVFVEFFMDTGIDEECMGTPLRIFDGMDMEAEALLTTCGSNLPAPILSSSNMVFIALDYYSNRLDNKFLIKWRELSGIKKSNSSDLAEACQYIYTLNNQTTKNISSPGYPDGYAPNLNCEWVFETSPQYHMMVRILNRNFGTWSNFRICTYADVIKVYKKPSKNANWEMMTEMCNNSNTNEEVVGTSLMKIEFVTNKYLNGSGFEAQVIAVCGGTLTEPRGYIVFDKDNAHDFECQWNITVRSGRTIKLSFEKFDLAPNDPNNCKNYIIIRNGMFPDSPFLGNGKFCGPDTPSELESTSNHVYIKYSGLASIKGFKIKYEEASLDCGGHYQLSIEEPSVEISSPNYPNIPPVHTECIWTFRSLNGDSLRVDFEDRFDIGIKGCLKDYLELRDGGTELSPLIGVYCTDTPSTQFTKDNMLRMKFFTDSDEPRNGFKAKISLSYCGGTIKGIEGSLSTKSPHSVTSGSNCTWYLKAPLGFYLTIKFDSFNVATYYSNCKNRSDTSTVQLYEHSSIFGNDTDLGKFCGQVNTSVPINSSTNEVVVNYLSKSDRDSFSLSFEANKEGCGGTVTQESGTITSPGYPHIIHEDRYCFWRFKVPAGRRITFYMDDVDFDNTLLALFQGFVEGPKLAFQSEIKAGKTYETNDNTANILFWQQHQSNKRGFKMTYTSDKPTMCKGDFNQTYGTISIPQTNQSYRCEWDHTMSGEATLAVQVQMETNVTRIGSACRRTRTGIHLYSPLRSFNYIAQLCKSTGNKPLLFRSPYTKTKLVARRNTKESLNYTITYKTYRCGGAVLEEQGTISSPNYPNHPHTTMECSWLLNTSEDYKIKINITDLNLGNDCEKSYLIVYNGDSPFHPKIGKYCKNAKPDLIISQLNAVLIEYKYEVGGDETSKGFSLKFEPEIHGCGGIYHYKEAVIQTPNYGKDYPNNAECVWDIHAYKGNTIKFQFFNKFYIEESENCAKDFVEIFDWKNEKWTSLGKKCGRILPQEIISSNSQLRILFRSNEKITGSGFSAQWTWQCGGDLEASKTESFLMNPGYPVNEEATCVYKIKTLGGKGIVNIRFLDFNLEKDCPKNNLTIVGTISGRTIPSRQQVYCGTNKPIEQRFKDSVVITYTNLKNHWSNSSGFKLAYKDESCGGNITAPTAIGAPNTHDSGQLSMIRYYQPKISCTWYVTAPPNQIAVLSINKLGMSLALSCVIQMLEVYDGLTPRQPKKLATLCGHIGEESKPIPSTSNTMLVRLETTSYNFQGFEGEIYFTYGPSVGCGGTVNLTETKYISAPNNLPHMDCHWTIIAPKDYKVQIEFTKIKISGACNNPIRNHTYFCTCSFVEIRDGGGPFADLMSKLCSSDNDGQREFTTSWNTAFLRLYSAVAQNDVFSLTLRPIKSTCGPSELTVTKDLQELTSPQYPQQYPSDIKCTWVLVNPSLQGKVLLHFEDFDFLQESSVGEYGSCDDDKLQISDDPNRQIISEGYGPNAKFRSPTQMSRALFNQYTFCGKDKKPFDIYSTGNIVTLSFQSFAYGQKGRGFKLKYGTSGCNRTIYANEGRIQSDYTDKNNCNITIVADKNRTLSLYFLTFYILYSNVNCSNYGLEIRENNSTGTELLRTCGFRTPNPVFSDSNQLYIRAYNTKGLSIFSQYNFLFVSSDQGKGCGGKIFNFKGKFSSPMYPNPYRQDIECTWEVTVPKGFKVALKFSEFDIVGLSYKNKVVVTTYGSSVPTEHEFSSKDTPAILFSDVKLELKYYSSVNNGGTGWLVVFQAVKEESDPLVWF